jgi:hypothetical protein
VAGHVQAFVTLLEGDKPSNKTIRNYVGILSSLFRYAELRKLGRSNPCDRVELRAKAIYGHDIRVLDPVEGEALAHSAVGGPYREIDRAVPDGSDDRAEAGRAAGAPPARR